jgi:hypothetical protein
MRCTITAIAAIGRALISPTTMARDIIARTTVDLIIN